jgi:diphosphomevalonate decarboxylase
MKMTTSKMSTLTATAIAHPNLALIKYWGNRDDRLRLPCNGSISINLDGLFARTQVAFDVGFTQDSLLLNGKQETGKALERMTGFLDLVRGLAGRKLYAIVASENNFPTGAGIASSAAAYAALSLAATHAFGLDLNEADLSRLARRGSGSACRSIPGGFVEWLPGADDASSYAVSIAPPEHWHLVDCIAIVEPKPKATGSTEGHHLAATSPLQSARVADAPRRLDVCRRAILDRDFEALAAISELDSTLMHAVMMTSSPPLFYWQPASLHLMKEIADWRQHGLPACYTLDAGPNVHVLCLEEAFGQVKRRLEEFPEVCEVLVSRPGGAARRE